MQDKNLENFVKEWNSKQTLDRGNKKILICPIMCDDTIFSFQLRFVHTVVNKEEFERFKNRVFSTSKGLLQVTSSLGNLRSGVLSIAVLVCNHGYSDKVVQKSLMYILGELLPALRN